MQIQRTGSDFVLFPPPSADSSSSDMLGLESSRAHHPPFFAQQRLPVDSAIMDPFSYPDDFHAFSQSQDPARSLPHSFYDTPSMYVESTPDKPLAFPPVPSTPPMATSPFFERMPTSSSASGASVASGPPSAMGSPNAGAANAFREGWIDTNHGLGLPPAVMGELPSEYNQIGSAVDPDTFATGKFPDYVGE